HRASTFGRHIRNPWILPTYSGKIHNSLARSCKLLEVAFMKLRSIFASFVLLLCGVSFAAAQSEPLIKKDDRIAIIGNTLADRMQHDGWLETYLVSRFPNYNLVFRNLGFAADEINPNLRLRSKNFGSPDSWLTQVKADVVFAF